VRQLWSVVLLLLATASFAGDYQDLEWLDLMPKDEVEALAKAQEQPVNHEIASKQGGSYRTIKALDQKQVRLAGYVVPVEQSADGKIREFFFVPYYGACIHMPPPPPNNIIYVKLKKPQADIDMVSAYWLEGTLKIAKFSHDIAATAYQMDANQLKIYE
jgi:uncharacterized protein